MRDKSERETRRAKGKQRRPTATPTIRLLAYGVGDTMSSLCRGCRYRRRCADDPAKHLPLDTHVIGAHATWSLSSRLSPICTSDRVEPLWVLQEKVFFRGTLGRARAGTTRKRLGRDRAHRRRTFQVSPERHPLESKARNVGHQNFLFRRLHHIWIWYLQYDEVDWVRDSAKAPLGPRALTKPRCRPGPRSEDVLESGLSLFNRTLAGL